MIQFGAGNIFALPLTTIGNPATNPTPVQPLSLQDSSVEFDQKIEQLRGQYKYADDIAPGDCDIKGKMSFGQSEIIQFNNLMFSGATAAGITATQPNEVHSVPSPSGPYTILIAPPGSGTFSKDAGVRYGTTGAPLQKVASGPTIGQYSVSAGTYTFAAADAGAAVLISYTYTLTTTGNTLTISNQQQGFGPAVEVYFNKPYQGTNGLHLFYVRCSKFAIPTKRSGYEIYEVDFMASANPAGQVWEWFQQSA